jgi:tartronate-semialdehyde synthase
LIRQAQRGFDMDYHVSLAFDNINSQEDEESIVPKGYGVDHLRVAEGLGCKAIQVVEPGDIAPALVRAQQLAQEHKVPVVVEIFLEKITNIAMGTELDNVVEFNDLAESLDDAPTAAALLLD